MDESAWYDDDPDDQDMPDWRDVRRLKALLEKKAPEREDPLDEDAPDDPPK